MVRERLSNDAWKQMADVFGEPASTGRPRKDPRDMVDGIFYVLRTGCPWRDLTEVFGLPRFQQVDERRDPRRDPASTGRRARRSRRASPPSAP